MPFMNQKRSYSLSTKFHWNFYDLIKIRLIAIKNVNILTMNIYFKMSWKLFGQLTKTKLKFRGKCASFEFNYQRRLILITVHKLSEHCFWQNWLNLYDYPVDTRRRFNVSTTWYDVVRRRIDVETTLYVNKVIWIYLSE